MCDTENEFTNANGKINLQDKIEKKNLENKSEFKYLLNNDSSSILNKSIDENKINILIDLNDQKQKDLSTGQIMQMTDQISNQKQQQTINTINNQQQNQLNTSTNNKEINMSGNIEHEENLIDNYDTKTETAKLNTSINSNKNSSNVNDLLNSNNTKMNEQQPSIIENESPSTQKSNNDLISDSDPIDLPKRIYVSNIPFKYDDKALRALFNQFGTVLDAEVIYNNRGSKGFGFVTFASTKDAERAKAKLNGTMVLNRRIEVNDATERVQKKPTNINNLTTNLNNFNTNLMNKNLANLVAGLNPSSLPALMNLNRLASLNMLGNLVAVQQPLLKQNLNTNDFNTALNAAINNSNLTSQPVLSSAADYANTLAQLSNSLTNPLLLNNLVAEQQQQQQQQQLNFIQPTQTTSVNSSIVQPTSATKFQTSPNVILNSVVANNTAASNVQLSPNSTNNNVCSANNYLNNLINNQLLAQLTQSNHLHHYTATNNLNNTTGVSNTQNNHAVTTSNLTLNLPTTVSNIRSLNNRNNTRSVNSSLTRGLSPSSGLPITPAVMQATNRTRHTVSAIQQPSSQSTLNTANNTNSANLLDTAGNSTETTDALHAYSAQQLGQSALRGQLYTEPYLGYPTCERYQLNSNYGRGYAVANYAPVTGIGRDYTEPYLTTQTIGPITSYGTKIATNTIAVTEMRLQSKN